MTGFTYGRPWRRLRARVLAEEPTCQLRLPGCTRISTTADHIVPVRDAPELALERSNVRGACAHCNSARAAASDPRRGGGSPDVPDSTGAFARDPWPYCPDSHRGQSCYSTTPVPAHSRDWP